MNKKGFTLVETVISVFIIVFAATAILEMLGSGIKNIDRLTRQSNDRYFFTFLLNDDTVMSLGTRSDFSAYITSKYPIDNQKVADSLKDMTFIKDEDETTSYMVNGANENILHGFEKRLELGGKEIKIFGFKEDKF